METFITEGANPSEVPTLAKPIFESKQASFWLKPEVFHEFFVATKTAVRVYSRKDPNVDTLDF